MTLTIKKETGYIIRVTTFCACCKKHDFVMGIFTHRDIGRNHAVGCLAHNDPPIRHPERTAVDIREIEYEQISDGRIVVDGSVIPSGGFRFGAQKAHQLRRLGTQIFRLTLDTQETVHG